LIVPFVFLSFLRNQTKGKTLFFIYKILFFGSNQEDVFQLVGVPLVKNALAGYNTAILSYGQVIYRMCFIF